MSNTEYTGGPDILGTLMVDGVPAADVTKIFVNRESRTSSAAGRVDDRKYVPLEIDFSHVEARVVAFLAGQGGTFAKEVRIISGHHRVLAALAAGMELVVDPVTHGVTVRMVRGPTTGRVSSGPLLAQELERMLAQTPKRVPQASTEPAPKKNAPKGKRPHGKWWMGR